VEGPAFGLIEGQVVRVSYQWIAHVGQNPGAFDFVGQWDSADNIAGTMIEGNATSPFTAKRVTDENTQVQPHAVQSGLGAGRVPTSFQWYYQFIPKGWRFWTQTSATTWTERYDTGEQTIFTLTGNEIVNNCSGVVVLKGDQSTQVFIPDDQCTKQEALFRFVGPSGPTSQWRGLGLMQQVRY
jgi:hypothetical protein